MVRDYLDTHPMALRCLMLLATCDAVCAGWMVRSYRAPVAIGLWPLAISVLCYLQAPMARRVLASYTADRGRGARFWPAVEAALAAGYGQRVAALVVREPRLLWSLFLLIGRRYDGAPASRFTAHRGALPVWLLLAVLAGLEVAATPLLPLPHWLHVVLLVLGLWGVVVVLGMIAALVVHPHLIDGDEVALRAGFWDQLVIKRSNIAAARRCYRPAVRGLHVEAGTATITPMSEVNVLIELRASAISSEGVPYTRAMAWVDDDAAFLAALG